MTGSPVMTMVVFGSDGNNDLIVTIMKTWYGMVWWYMVWYGVVCNGAVPCGMVRTRCNYYGIVRCGMHEHANAHRCAIINIPYTCTVYSAKVRACACTYTKKMYVCMRAYAMPMTDLHTYTT